MAGAFGHRPAADRAQLSPVLGQSQQLSPVLVGVQRLADDDRADQPVTVVLVFDDLGGLAAVQPGRWDTLPVGGLYPGTESWLSSDAAREKGTSTARVFKFHAAVASRSHCLSVSASCSRSS